VRGLWKSWRQTNKDQLVLISDVVSFSVFMESGHADFVALKTVLCQLSKLSVAKTWTLIAKLQEGGFRNAKAIIILQYFFMNKEKFAGK